MVAQFSTGILAHFSISIYIYAAKIAVENDGRLKIGLYGEVKL